MKKKDLFLPLSDKFGLQFFAGPSFGVYDANLVSTIVDGVELTGYMSGTFVTSKKTETAVKPLVSPQGDAAFAINNNTLGEIKVVLNQTSPSIAYLNAIAASKRMVPIWVHSLNEVKEKSGGLYAMINTQPEASYSDEITGREYVFLVLDYTFE